MKINAAYRLKATSIFKYACFNRPPGIGAVPKDYVNYEPHVPDVPSARHGVISYDRELTDSEVRQYELVPLGKEGHELVVPKIPVAVLNKAKEALETLNYIDAELKSGSLEKEEVQDSIDDALKTLATFKSYLTSKHLDYSRAIEELGGAPKI